MKKTQTNEKKKEMFATLEYKLQHAPAFVCDAKQCDIDVFNDVFQDMTKKGYWMLQQQEASGLAADTLLSSCCGGITLGEFCMLWIRINAYHQNCNAPHTHPYAKLQHSYLPDKNTKTNNKKELTPVCSAKNEEALT